MPLMETLQDDFSGSFNTTRWPSAFGHAIVSGQLQITDSSGSYPAVISGYSYTIAGSYLLARVTPATPSGSNSQQTYMSVGNNGGNNVVAIYRDGNNLMRLIKTNGVDASTVIGTYNATTMAWWRIRHSGTQWFTAYSADGITWTEQAGFTTSWAITADGMAAGLMTGKWSSGDANAVAYFDNINMPPSGSTAKSGSDTGSGTDSAGGVARASTGSDTASGTDSSGSVVQTAAKSGSDTASALDSAGSTVQTNTRAGSDTASGTEAVSGRRMPNADTASGTDASPSRRTSVTEPVSSTDNAGTVRQPKEGSDTGAGTDNAGTVLRRYTGAEPVPATDAVTNRRITGGGILADTSTIAEAGNVANLAPVNKSGSDFVSSTEDADPAYPGEFSQIPSPRDWSNGDDMDAGTLNREWRDTFLWLLRSTLPAIEVYNSDGASLTYTSNVAIPLKTEVMKRGNLVHAPNDTKVYVYEPGWYLGVVNVGMSLSGVTGGTSLASVVKVNGFVTSTNELARIAGTNLQAVNHQFQVYLNAGDYVEIALAGTWTGTATSATNEFAWPRLDLYWRSHWST